MRPPRLGRAGRPTLGEGRYGKQLPQAVPEEQGTAAVPIAGPGCAAAGPPGPVPLSERPHHSGVAALGPAEPPAAAGVLVPARAVNRPRGQHVPLASPQPLVYSLSNAGARLLVQRLETREFREGQEEGEPALPQVLRGLEEVKLNIDWNENSGRAKLPYIEHTLMIARFRAALTAALREQNNTRLVRWRQGPEIKGATNVDGQRVAVVPDGLFTLEDGEDLLHFCLEADRGTMTLARFREKLRAYWSWYLEGGHRRGWGMEAAFRVLSLTTSEKRRDNLWALGREVDGRRQGSPMFLFAAETDFRLEQPEAVLGEVWKCGVKECQMWHRLVE
jgi:hypothetical protein